MKQLYENKELWLVNGGQYVLKWCRVYGQGRFIFGKEVYGQGSLIIFHLF